MPEALNTRLTDSFAFAPGLPAIFRDLHLDVAVGTQSTASVVTAWCFLCSKDVAFWLQAFVYLAGIQLLASHSWRSALAGGCGLLAGLAYQYNFLGLKRLKVHICCHPAVTIVLT
jgi:hypothetical protein